MNILMIGGTGFIGSAIARRLAAQGHVLRLPTRRRERAKHLIVLPTVGVVEADVHDPAVLAALMKDQDAVISMAGILRGDFARVHAELPAKIAAAAKAADVRRIVHISALGAAADAPSAYQRSKAAGEAALQASGLDVTIIRPSVVFGAGDSFMRLFAGLQKCFPVLPLACPQARMQPVWVEDVAQTVVLCLQRPDSAGQVYELGGPGVYTLRELVEYAGATGGSRALVVGLPAPLAWLQAFAMEIVGGPMTRDNLLSLQQPNICATAPSLPFDLQATALEAIAPTYLGKDRRSSGRDRHREGAGR
jgi:NADH dehydrogenase